MKRDTSTPDLFAHERGNGHAYERAAAEDEARRRSQAADRAKKTRAERYPDTPGHNATDTSTAAATSMKEGAAAIRRRILAEIQIRGSTGATCDEIEQAMGFSHQTASARLRELVLNRDEHGDQKPLISDGGARRKTRSGRNAIVWVATEGQR